MKSNHTSLLVAVMLIWACNNPSAVSEQAESNVETVAEESTQQVLSTPVPDAVQCTGTLMVPASDYVTVHAHIPAHVEKIFVQPGQKVKKGDPLVILESIELIQLQESYLKALAESKRAENSYKRTKQLFETQSVSDKDMEIATEQYESSRASLFSLEQQVMLAGLDVPVIKTGKIIDQLVITAPISGTVSSLDASLGLRKEDGDAICTITDRSNLYINIALQSFRVENIREGARFSFSRNGTGKWYPGHVQWLGDRVDPENNTIAVRGVPDTLIVAGVGEKVVVRFE